MANKFHTPTVLVLSIALLFIVTSNAQVNTSKARKVTARADSYECQGRTRRPPRGLTSNTARRLPFEDAVIIYYTAPRKVPAPVSKKDPAVPNASAFDRSSSPGEAQAAKARPSSARSTSESIPSLRSQTGSQFQPVLIYYKTYASAATVKGPALPKVEPSSKTTAPTIRNESAAILKRGNKPEPVTSSDDLVSGSGRLVALHKPTSVATTAGNETTSASTTAGSNADRTAGVRAPIETTAIETGPAVPTGSANRQAAIAPAIEPAHVAVAESAEKSIVPASEPIEFPIDKNEVVRPPEPLTELMTTSAASQAVTTPTDRAANSSSSASTNPALVESETGSMDAVGLNNSAVRLTFEKQYNEARTLLQRAIETQPGIAKFHRNLSIVFEKLKMNDEALASARTAEKLSPTDPSVVEQVCGLELDTGNSTAALACYERLDSIQPLDGLSQSYYGIALFRSGKVDESISVLEKVSETTPAIPLAINALGVAYYEKKRFKDAAAAFKNAVEIAPEIFETRYNLAVTQLSLRNKAGAISQYNILKAESPELAAQLYRILYSDKIAVAPQN